MSTALQRQRQREDTRISTAATAMLNLSPRAVADQRARQRLALVTTPATQAQLAVVARNLETILAAQHTDPDTGEVHSQEMTKRVVTLADMMHKDGQIDMVLHRAADAFRELFIAAMGSSKGVSSYGEYSAPADAFGRLPAVQNQLDARAKLKQASVAAFGTLREDGRNAIDEELMHLVVPAIVSDRRQVTQGSIGQRRGRYSGSAQVRAAGGMIVQEVLQRLSLHFAYRER